MPIARANGIEVCYDTFGSPGHEPLLLIRGLGGQMIAWREGFCELLAGHGFHVIRFDNRDVGLSTKFDGAPAYTLQDMSEDAVGLLDHLEVAAVHVAGMSMGGMIAQRMAIDHPERVLSLASIMSHMGGGDAVPPTPEALSIFTKPPANTREEVIEAAVADRRVIGSPGFDVDEDDLRETAAIAYDRCYAPDGVTRQATAIQTAPSRKDALSRLEIPVVVIHGTDDPLVPFENGVRTADAVPGAELVAIEGMGHDIPAGAWPVIVDAIVINARSVRTTG